MKTEIQIKIEAMQSELSRFIANEIANGAEVQKMAGGAFIGDTYISRAILPDSEYDASILLHVTAPEIADAVAPARESLEDERKRLEYRLKQIDVELEKGGAK